LQRKEGEVVIRIVLIIMNIFLAVNQAYCQALTENEWNIYYDGVETELSLPDNLTDKEIEVKNEEFCRSRGITLREFNDIMEAAILGRPDAPLTDQESKVAGELKARLSSYGGKPPRRVLYDACREVSAKYGMRPGKAADIYYWATAGDD